MASKINHPRYRGLCVSISVPLPLLRPAQIFVLRRRKLAAHGGAAGFATQVISSDICFVEEPVKFLSFAGGWELGSAQSVSTMSFNQQDACSS